MPCADIGTKCGHLIANQGKSGHIISIYPDAIPMSRLSIPVSGNAIQTQTTFVFHEDGQREHHSRRHQQWLAFRLST